jgi:hypothetical protein
MQSEPIDVGNDFYARIENVDSGLDLTNQEKEVVGKTTTGEADQLWHFVQNENGSYQILNKMSEGCMEVQEDTNDNTNVIVASNYSGKENQQFYIYNQYNAYYFRPVHSYSNVLDMDTTLGCGLKIRRLETDRKTQAFRIIKVTNEQEKVISGDVNGDSVINGIDMSRLKQYFAGYDVSINETNADVTGDGEVTNTDLVRLRRFLVGDPKAVLN